MKSLIYKFTIKTNKKFYIGQYTGNKFDLYWGSGSIWKDEIKGLRRKFPKQWKKLIKREILFESKNYNQKVLDKMEEYFIKKEQSHYSYRKGGCNVLWGTSNEFGSGSPMKDPLVAKKQSISYRLFIKNNPEKMKKTQQKRIWALNNTDYKERISKTLKGRYSGEKNPNYGNKWTEEQKIHLSEKMKGRYSGEKNPNYGNKWTEEQKIHLSEKMKGRYSGEKNPMFDKVRITNGIINTIISKDEKLPEGFWYGMKKRGT